MLKFLDFLRSSILTAGIVWMLFWAGMLFRQLAIYFSKLMIFMLLVCPVWAESPPAGSNDDLPPFSDLDRFRPPYIRKKDFRKWSNDRWNEGVKFCNWINEQMTIPICVRSYECKRVWPWEEYWEVVRGEARFYERSWDLLDWATLQMASPEDAREWLRQLKEKIGPDRYALGWEGMVPPVPYQYFPERR
jgi:hypothetical protein